MAAAAAKPAGMLCFSNYLYELPRNVKFLNVNKSCIFKYNPCAVSSYVYKVPASKTRRDTFKRTKTSAVLMSKARSPAPGRKTSMQPSMQTSAGINVASGKTNFSSRPGYQDATSSVTSRHFGPSQSQSRGEGT